MSRGELTGLFFLRDITFAGRLRTAIPEVGIEMNRSGLDFDQVAGGLGIELWSAVSPAGKLSGVQAEAVEEEADIDGALDEVIDLHRTHELD